MIRDRRQDGVDRSGSVEEVDLAFADVLGNVVVDAGFVAYVNVPDVVNADAVVVEGDPLKSKVVLQDD